MNTAKSSFHIERTIRRKDVINKSHVENIIPSLLRCMLQGRGWEVDNQHKWAGRVYLKIKGNQHADSLKLNQLLGEGGNSVARNENIRTKDRKCIKSKIPEEVGPQSSAVILYFFCSASESVLL